MNDTVKSFYDDLPSVLSSTSSSVSSSPLPPTHKRFMLFSNDMCAGIFPSGGPSNVTRFVIISSNGEFAYISCGGDSRTHLTRFVPSDFGRQTSELLVFRNSLVPTAYLCRRFNEADEYSGDNTIRFSSHHTAGGKVTYSNGANSISLSSFGKIVNCNLNVVFADDDVSGRSSPYSPKLCTKVSTYYPIARAPEDVAGLFFRDKDAHDSRMVAVQVPRAENCGAKESKEAMSMFETLAPELSLFLNTNHFPKSFLTVAECINDSFIYIRSGPVDSVDVEVECWMLHAPDEQPDLRRPWNVGTLLSLKRDVFRLQKATDGEEKGLEVHISFLNLIGSSDDIDYDAFAGSGDTSMLSLLACFEQAYHLFGLKAHTEEYFQLFGKQTKTTENSRSVQGIETVTDTYVRKSDGARFSRLFDGRIRGVFRDRTMLEMRPEETVVRAILPSGEDAIYNLEKCIGLGTAAANAYHSTCPKFSDSAAEMSVYAAMSIDTVLGHCVSPCPQPSAESLGFGAGSECPTIPISQYVVALVAFKHWAAVPSEQRADEETKTKRLLEVARSEYQKSNCFLITSALKDKNITLEQATVLSNCQHASLQTEVRRASSSRDASHTNTEREEVRHFSFPPDSPYALGPVSGLHSPSPLDGWCKAVDAAMEQNRQFLDSLEKLP